MKVQEFKSFFIAILVAYACAGCNEYSIGKKSIRAVAERNWAGLIPGEEYRGQIWFKPGSSNLEGTLKIAFYKDGKQVGETHEFAVTSSMNDLDVQGPARFEIDQGAEVKHKTIQISGHMSVLEFGKQSSVPLLGVLPSKVDGELQIYDRHERLVTVYIHGSVKHSRY